MRAVILAILVSISLTGCMVAEVDKERDLTDTSVADNNCDMTKKEKKNYYKT